MRSLIVASDDEYTYVINIFKYIDPAKKALVNTTVVLSSIGFGYYAHDDSIKGLVTRVIEHTPALNDAFWSPGTTGSLAKTSSMKEALADIKKQIEVNLQNTLSLIQGVNQTDVTLFLALTRAGDFTVDQRDAPRVTANGSSAQDLSDVPFRTYLITSALVQNNWSALMSPGVDASRLRYEAKACPSWGSAGCHVSRSLGCDRSW